MNGLPDAQLLREYAERGAEAAFGELVRRHIDQVYSAALRMVCDARLAEDVTQGVFLALSRSAAQLTGHPLLSGWLHLTTRNLAASAVRSDVRRRTREQEAAATTDLLSNTPDAPWEEIGPHLDAAMGELSEPDRDALLLRYFERKSAREMAQSLGTSAEAAQKRVSRAVERLRELLAKRGITAGAGGLAVLLSANAVQAAPIGLGVSITSSAALTGTALATLATSTTAKTLAMTALQKTCIAIALAAAMGVGIYEARQASLLRAQVKSLQQQPVPQLEPSQDAVLGTLRKQLQALEAQQIALADALTRANAEKARLETERDQAGHRAALYQELIAQANSKGTNPTNAYPSARHVWAAFGRMGRIAALSKEDESKLSPEEKSALEVAKASALDELPNLVRAARQYDAGRGADLQSDEMIDEVACLLYGALNLDERQFGQVYGVMRKLHQESRLKGLSKDTPASEAAEALRQVMEQWKAETQMLLTPEQNRIFAEVVTHLQVEPGKFGFNFNF